LLNESQIPDLINRCRKFDGVAQKELYLRFADDLMTVAIRYASDLPAAKDLVHDSFLKIFQNIQKFKTGQGSFQGWMTRILINEALQKSRRDRRIIYSEAENMPAEQSVEFGILEELAAEDILEMIQQLPEGCRVIFNLALIEGFKHNEIAELLNISASASRAQLTRARKLLKAQLASKKKVRSMNA